MRRDHDVLKRSRTFPMLHRSRLLSLGAVAAFSMPADINSNKTSASGFIQPAIAQQPSLRLEMLGEYGAEEPPPNVVNGGPAFARIASVRVFPDGRVAVLDVSYRKVALFAKDGRFLRTIGKGIGKGPGEFQLPNALDVHNDRIAVFDYEGNRVTVFDTTGNVLLTRHTPRAHNIVLAGDTIYGSAKGNRQFLLWRQSGTDVAAVTRLAPVSAQVLRDHDPVGVGASLERAGNGVLLLTNGRPGFWHEVRAGRISPVKGVDLLDKAKFRRYQDMLVAPGTDWGIIPLSDRYLGIAFAPMIFASDGRPSMGTRELAVFDRNSGALVGNVLLPGGAKEVAVIGGGAAPFELLIARQEPFLRVVRMVLRGLE